MKYLADQCLHKKEFYNTYVYSGRAVTQWNIQSFYIKLFYHIIFFIFIFLIYWSKLMLGHTWRIWTPFCETTTISFRPSPVISSSSIASTGSGNVLCHSNLNSPLCKLEQSDAQSLHISPILLSSESTVGCKSGMLTECTGLGSCPSEGPVLAFSIPCSSLHGVEKSWSTFCLSEEVVLHSWFLQWFLCG